MTELRNRMNEAMVLRGFSPRTRESYLACVRALAKHYCEPPDGLDGPRIQAYLLHLISERKLAYPSAPCWRSCSRAARPPRASRANGA